MCIYMHVCDFWAKRLGHRLGKQKAPSLIPSYAKFFFKFYSGPGVNCGSSLSSCNINGYLEKQISLFCLAASNSMTSLCENWTVLLQITSLAPGEFACTRQMVYRQTCVKVGWAVFAQLLQALLCVGLCICVLCVC